jgi:POT family proton-dependent oligopeptide transporter
MKSAIMALWSLSVTFGNLWVLLVNAAVRNDTVTQAIAGSGWGVMTFQMFFFAGVAFLASLAFGLYAARYTLADHYRQTSKE